jgi:hypothetical protein
VLLAAFHDNKAENPMKVQVKEGWLSSDSSDEEAEDEFESSEMTEDEEQWVASKQFGDRRQCTAGAQGLSSRVQEGETHT